MQHLEEGEVHEWLDGQMSAAQSLEVERHVAECAVCAALVVEARGFIAASSRILTALDAVPGDVLPAPAPDPLPATDDLAARREKAQPRRRFTFPVRAAAVLMVAALGAVTLSRVGPGAISESGRITVADAVSEKDLAVSAPMPAAAAAVETAPVQPPAPAPAPASPRDEAATQVSRGAERTAATSGAGAAADGRLAAPRVSESVASSAPSESQQRAASPPTVAAAPPPSPAPMAANAAGRAERREANKAMADVAVQAPSAPVTGAAVGAVAGARTVRPLATGQPAPGVAGCYRIDATGPTRMLDLRTTVLEEERDPAARVLFIRGSGQLERASWVALAADSLRLELERTSLQTGVRAVATPDAITGITSDGRAFRALRAAPSACGPRP